MITSKPIVTGPISRRTAIEREESRQITANWIYMMENQNMVPVDKKRRWLLARILDIPPLLLGLESIEEVLPTHTRRIFQWERVDTVEYQAVLEQYCTSWGTGRCYEAAQDIRQRIDNLFNACSTL
ncbi:MAG: hypothetical protein IMW89_12860 [Ktedonobacteraceae bacterium]|nr:hypothetical protein [Ktedonobacteraceae bacterium]